MRIIETIQKARNGARVAWNIRRGGNYFYDNFDRCGVTDGQIGYISSTRYAFCEDIMLRIASGDKVLIESAHRDLVNLPRQDMLVVGATLHRVFQVMGEEDSKKHSLASIARLRRTEL